MTLDPCRVGCDRLRVNGPEWLGANESYCGRGGDGPVAFNAQRQSLGFLFWMVPCSFTLYLLISHGMKTGGSVYSFIHSFIKGKCSRRYRKAQEGSGRLRKAPEMNIKHRHKQCILTYSHDNEISCDIVVLFSWCLEMPYDSVKQITARNIMDNINTT